MALRLAGFVLILALLGASGWAMVERARTGHAPSLEGPVRDNTPDEVVRIERTGAAFVLGEAAKQLARVKAVTGSYDGPDLRNFVGVRLVYATDAAYCMEWSKIHTFSLAGPGGEVVLGGCA